MDIKNNDVKVLGRIAAITVDGIVADAQQIYDELYAGGEFQSKINSDVKSWIDEVSADLQSHVNNKSNPHGVTKGQVGLSNVTNDAQVKRTEMGTVNGVATLNESGKVPSTQLPSYVDDVLEYANVSSFPQTGETGKIYVALDTNLTYRWTGSTYVEISQSLALGETSSTAYPGDKGAANRAAINSLPPDILAYLSIGSRYPNYLSLMKISYSKSGMSYDKPESGDSLELPAATPKFAGLMTAANCADFNELTGIADAGILYNELRASASSTAVTIECDIAERTDSSNWSPVIKSIEIPSASVVQAGVMSIAMFNKLRGIAEGANNYTLPAATASTLGGVKVGSDLSVTADGVLSVNAETISNTDIDSLFT